jgi:DNA-binding NarL/FixJ family response regulator
MKQGTNSGLNPAEWQVVHLKAQGLSYVQIAMELGKTRKTVDAQICSISRKMVHHQMSLIVACERLSGCLGS